MSICVPGLLCGFGCSQDGEGEGEKDLRGTLVSEETPDALTGMEMLRPATGIS